MPIAWSDGHREALERLAGTVQAELRKPARTFLRRERPDHTLQPTALVNEAYVRLIDQDRVRWRNRAHFYGIAASCLRSVLLDYGRQHKDLKRDSGQHVVTFDDTLAKLAADPAVLGQLAEAVEELAALDRRQADWSSSGFSEGSRSRKSRMLLHVSAGTVKRDWVTAKLWLRRLVRRAGCDS